jgi:hypothetical protein
VPKLEGLWDYGNKAWSGLVGPYYGKRYQIFADHQLGNITKPGSFDKASYISDQMQWAQEFQQRTWDEKELPAVPTGDAVALSRAMWLKYKPRGT